MINKNNLEHGTPEVFKLFIDNYKSTTTEFKQTSENSTEKTSPLSPILSKRKSVFNNNCSKNKRNKVDGSRTSTKATDSVDVCSFTGNISELAISSTNNKVELENDDLPLSPILGNHNLNPSAIPLKNVSPLSSVLCEWTEEKELTHFSKLPTSMQPKLPGSCFQNMHAVFNRNDTKTPAKCSLSAKHNETNELLSQTNSPVLLGYSMFEKPVKQVPSSKKQLDNIGQTSPVLLSNHKQNILFNTRKTPRIKDKTFNMNEEEVLHSPNHNQIENHNRNNLTIAEITLGDERQMSRKESEETSPAKQEHYLSPILNSKKNTNMNDSPLLCKISGDLSESYKETKVLSKCNVIKTIENEQAYPTDLNLEISKCLSSIEYSAKIFQRNQGVMEHFESDQSSLEFDSKQNQLEQKEKLTNHQYFVKNTSFKYPLFSSELELCRFPLNFIQIEETIFSPWVNMTKDKTPNTEFVPVLPRNINQLAKQEIGKHAQAEKRFSLCHEIIRMDKNKNLSQNVSDESSFHRSNHQVERLNIVESRKFKDNSTERQPMSLVKLHANSNYFDHECKITKKPEIDFKINKLRTAKKNLSNTFYSMGNNETASILKCSKERNSRLDEKGSILEEEMGSSILQYPGKPLVLKDELSKFSDFHTPKVVTTLKTCSAKKSKNKNKACKTNPYKYMLEKKPSLWEHEESFYISSNKLNIEEFEDESPLNITEIANITCTGTNEQKNINTIISKPSQQPILKESIVISKRDTNTCKSLLSSGSKFHHDFETCPDEVDIQRSKSDSSDESEEEVEVEIQVEASQESGVSAGVQIHYSTSPNTKSTQDALQNEITEKISLPPELKFKTEEDKTNIGSLLDSVSKTKRMKLKRGGLVERLRRLVRTEKADVNMFHYEDVTRNTKGCSLVVHSVTRICSRNQLVCSYTDTSFSSSVHLSAGEEVIDPEVQVFIDPNYSKTITPGCIIWIYPPWSSLWVEGRDLMIIYCVSKLRVVGLAQVPQTLRHRLSNMNLQNKFFCLSLDQNCGCSRELMAQLFGLTNSQAEKCLAELSIRAAFSSGGYPHNVSLKLTFLHRFQTRRKQDGKVLSCVLCIDGNGHFCQFNMKTDSHISMIDSLMNNSDSNTIILHKLVIYKRIIIDRCKGLRTMLTYLSTGSVTQQLMYVLTPLSAEWSAEVATEHSSTLVHAATLFSLVDCQVKDGRGEGEIQVLSLRGDKLYAYEKSSESFFKINIAPSAVISEIGPRAFLRIKFLSASAGELTLDKFSSVTVAEPDSDQLINIPHLSANSKEGDLVLLDGVVTKVNSEIVVRWTGDCGHKLLRLQETQLFYCVNCKLTVTACKQQLALEVCVATTSVSAPIRIKIKSETTQSFLVGKDGKITPGKKSYNLISAIGGPLKCTAVILEVLKNPFDDISEFLLEEI